METGATPVLHLDPLPNGCVQLNVSGFKRGKAPTRQRQASCLPLSRAFSTAKRTLEIQNGKNSSGGKMPPETHFRNA